MKDCVEKAATRGLALYDVVPCALGDEARTAEDILRTHRETGLDTFLYSVTLDPRGRPAFDAVEAAMASFRAVKGRIGGSGVKFGFLLQAIVGHWPRVDREIEPWQRAIDVEGRPTRFCVLDERYRSYIRRTAAALAAEKPCFILGDDDIRPFSPFCTVECFCPLHVAEFNRRAGTSYTAERLRAAVASCAAGDKVSDVFLRLRNEIPATVAREIRAGIDSVDPSIPSGTCMPGAANHAILDVAETMAGGHPVVLRLANGLYTEFSAWTFAEVVLRTQGYVALFRDRVGRLLDEADTFPHTLYSRSGRTFHAKLAAGVFNGLDGAKLWFVGMHKGTERVPEAYDRDFAVHLRFYEALHEAVARTAPAGVRIPVSASAPPAPGRREGLCAYARHDWAQGCFSLYGVPFHADASRAPGGILFLEGAETVARLSDAELEEAFGGLVFADGAAAQELDRRGLAAWLGCRPSGDDMAYNAEVVCATGERPPIAKGETIPPLVDVAPSAKVFSELRYSPVGPDVPSTAFVSAGAVVFENPRGGRAFTSSFSVPNGFCNLNLRRKAWLAAALRALDPGFPVICGNAEPNMTLARRTPEGGTLAMTLNMGYDDIQALRYETPRAMSAAETLQPDGSWKPAGAALRDGAWVFPASLPPFGVAVVRW